MHEAAREERRHEAGHIGVSAPLRDAVLDRELPRDFLRRAPLLDLAGGLVLSSNVVGGRIWQLIEQHESVI